MKFMKLGSRPDTFYTTEAVRSVSSEVSSDLLVEVKGCKYLLHKFPLLSKSLLLQRLHSESPESSHIHLLDFPTGIESFEVCVKFCYGIAITLSPYNIVSIRCAAEHLQMFENVEKGNLVQKVEAFFTSCILNGWRDTIVTLQSTKSFPLWSENLGITGQCIEAIASLVKSNGSGGRRRKPVTSIGWWGEDLAELEIDLYWRSIIAVKSGGKIPSKIIGDVLRIYASRWLYLQEESDCESKKCLILESIVSLLPAEKGAVSCSFLLKLLKAANMLNASSSTKIELASRVGIQLEEATVGDLLVPCLASTNDMIYDVDIVIIILEQFMLQAQSPQTSPPRKKRDFVERRRSRSAENVDTMLQESRRSSSASHSSKLKVAKLVDQYLQEIAKDKNLHLSKFITVAEAIPEFARLDHDDLYKAIDIYLKGHPELNKSERKRLCRILDCKKLSMETSIHAAQNEMLPLRVVVQVLFFEHNKTASRAKASFSTNADQGSNILGAKSPKSNLSTLKMRLAEDDDDDLNDNLGGGIENSLKMKSLSVVPNRPKRIFSKFWPIYRSASQKN
ncbi:hypothetical protein BUALT_Bualt05G0163500 [Buddleja alternifolia]|uniref:Phototropic-responsive NPH3 family protein n=1 Tax=Buddleja alternifolia TaxID=168488 RepID=A0AAV6XT18_9LAMI|nr:hypothetical protein BUALT_Bualt05G0163500 [Buddleja alternifolia]